MRFMLIVGPCAIESRVQVFEVADKMKAMTDKMNVDYYFKASFDKANRTSLNSYRGPGIKQGMEILQEVKEMLGVKICTDIHEPWQAEAVANVVDVIQIPAFLCRQTDLLVAAARTGKIINVVEKIRRSGNENICLCERGTSFGYNNLVVDMTSILEMKKLGVPVIFDATHSVQKPGGNGTSTSGNRDYAEYLARAAVAVGTDGIFMEVHPNPDEALSDSSNSVRLDEVEGILKRILMVREAVCQKGMTL